MIIRPSQPGDREQLADLVIRFRASLSALAGGSDAPSRQQAEDELDEYASKAYPIFVTEEEQGRLAGYLVCRVDGKTVWAESLFVEPDCRRRGIASALYSQAERLAKALGSKTVYNWVHPQNDVSIAFLKARGHDVLNMIELRRPGPDETPGQRIKVGRHEFRH